MRREGNLTILSNKEGKVITINHVKIIGFFNGFWVVVALCQNFIK